MRKELRVAPAGLAITVSEANVINYMKNTTRDDETALFINDAIDYVQSITGRALITSEWDIYADRQEFFDQANGCGYVDLSTLNVNSIESLTTFDRSGNATIVDSSTYRLSNNRIIFDSQSPNSDTREIDAVIVAVTAGYGATSTDMPANITTALAMYVKHWLDFKGKVVDRDERDIPDNIKAKLMQYRSTRNWIR